MSAPWIDLDETTEAELGTPQSLETHAAASSSLTIVVDHGQKANAHLNQFRELRHIYAHLIADCLITPTHALVFVSMQYHRLHPGYLSQKLHRVRACESYTHRTLLCHVDLQDFENALHEVNHLCFNIGFSLLLTWRPSESAELIEAMKLVVDKPPEAIQGKLSENHQQRVIDILVSIPTINKNDAVTLMKEHASFRALLTVTLHRRICIGPDAQAPKEQFMNVSGIGPKKLTRIWNFFHEPSHDPF